MYNDTYKVNGEFMSLQSELDDFAKRIASFHDPVDMTDAEWQEYADNTVVALMAGGESSRFRDVLDGQPVQKSVFELPNGDTMIEMTIRMFRDAGLKKFAALVFHNAKSTEERLGDGSSLGVEISYSYDPDMPVGRGGAIRHAIEVGAIPRGCNLIVTNPSDIIMNFPGSFPRFLASGHMEGQKKGMLASALLAPRLAYSANGMMVRDNMVVDTADFPLIPVPAHVGFTVFSPEALDLFIEMFKLNEKSDFEAVLFPMLCQQKKLWSVGLTKGIWYQVKDSKGYKQLVEALDI